MAQDDVPEESNKKRAAKALQPWMYAAMSFWGMKIWGFEALGSYETEISVAGFVCGLIGALAYRREIRRAVD